MRTNAEREAERDAAALIVAAMYAAVELPVSDQYRSDVQDVAERWEERYELPPHVRHEGNLIVGPWRAAKVGT